MGNSGLDNVNLALRAAALPLGLLVTVVFAISCFGDSLAIRKGTKADLLMAEAADQAQHDFWRPPMPVSKAVVIPERSATCHRCGTEFIVSSLYCHACGAGRPELRVSGAPPLQVPGLTELASLGGRLGLTTPALVAFLVGTLRGAAALRDQAEGRWRARLIGILWREDPLREVHDHAPDGRRAPWRTHIRCRGWKPSADGPP